MIGYITFSQWVAVYLSHLKQKNMKVRAVKNIANRKKCFHKNRLSWIGLKCIDSFKNSLSLRKPNLWVLGFHPWKEPWSIVWENQGSWKVKLDCITLLVPKNAPPTPPPTRILESVIACASELSSRSISLPVLSFQVHSVHQLDQERGQVCKCMKTQRQRHLPPWRRKTSQKIALRWRRWELPESCSTVPCQHTLHKKSGN